MSFKVNGSRMCPSSQVGYHFHIVAHACRRILLAISVVTFVGLGSVLPGRLHAQEPAETMEQRIERLELQVKELHAALALSPDSAALLEVRRQIEAITRELEELRLGEEVVARADTTAFGLGPAASKVYRADQGVSIGGYGEFRYQNFASEREDGEPSGRTDEFDALRAVFYVGYKFNDRFLFNSEIEFEHAGTSGGGSASVEFAYIDWRFRGARGSTGARGGLLLVPMGFINEMHEPPTYLGSRRPETERRIIPTTWRENGFGLFGVAADFDWRVYVVSGLDGSGFTAEGLRGGRQKGSRALAEDFAAVGRLDWRGVQGLVLSTSAYFGGSGQGLEDPLNPGGTIGAATLIVEGHVGYKARGLDLRGLFTLATVDDVASLNVANGLTGSESIGERLTGWYVQAGYDVLRGARTDVQLLPYVRFESVNTQDAVPDGFSADPANDLSLLTLGAQVLPIPQIVLKTDYTFQSTGADSGVDQWNVSLGYLF